MNILPQNADPRIAELNQLAADEGQPLALRPETIILLEDAGMVVEPFTAQFWRDPAVEPPTLTLTALADLMVLVQTSEDGHSEA